MRLIRRISDVPPGLDGSRGGGRCPDIWETDAGDYVVIGEDVTDEVRKALPANADVSPNEKVVVIAKDVLLSAMRRLQQLSSS